MPSSDLLDADRRSSAFAPYASLSRLAPAHGGRDESEPARHQLYTARETRTHVPVLIKVTTRPGVIYERNLMNELATLSTINAQLPDSRDFPWVHDHGHLDDGRAYVVMSLFEEFPLATTVAPERSARQLPAHLRAVLEVARALMTIHPLGIFHVDLNPMNVLYTVERGRPVIRIVDFESSWEQARHGAGEFYNPPTTPGYTAPEIPDAAPDARSDVFSLGAVLHTLIAGTLWVSAQDLRPLIAQDRTIDAELGRILRRAVEPDPADRYPSVASFHEALGTYVDRLRPGRR